MKSVLQTMDFSEWSLLAKRDPEAFESIRLHMIEELIESAGPVQQQRLRGLQWRIDQERCRSDSPLGACIRMSRMMWERVAGPKGLLDSIERLNEVVTKPDVPPSSPPPSSAMVIPFRQPT